MFDRQTKLGYFFQYISKHVFECLKCELLQRKSFKDANSYPWNSYEKQTILSRFRWRLPSKSYKKNHTNDWKTQMILVAIWKQHIFQIRQILLLSVKTVLDRSFGLFPPKSAFKNTQETSLNFRNKFHGKPVCHLFIIVLNASGFRF